MGSGGEATLVPASSRWRMGARADGRGSQVMKVRLGAGAGAAFAGLCLGLLALGPALGPGYVLAYDMVFVPSPRFNATMFGLTGTLPRAVPSDAVVTSLALVLPADVVQKCILLAIFVLACAGVARLLEGEQWLARLAAGVFYAWNPYVAERLLIGQWALLLGYAALPWVLAALTRPAISLARTSRRLLLALLPAAAGGFAAMSVAGLVAVPAAACRRGTARHRLATVSAAVGVLGLLSLPWLIPSLTRQVHTSPAGVAAFAARADTPFGTVGSVLMLGGMWNAQTVPAGYGGWVSVLWLCLVLIALAGFVTFGRSRWPGLWPAAVAGLALALAGSFGLGQHLLRAMISFWPGFAVLRDGQQFAAPLALAEAAGIGLAVAWVLRLRRPAVIRESAAVLAGALVVAPVLFLPGLAWGAAGRLRPVEYPASWLAARRIINANPQPGSALLLPWASYRRFGWNNGEAMLDPWPRLLTRTVIWNDGVQVGSVRLPPEDPAALALDRVIRSGRRLTSPLAAAGVRFVVVDGGPDAASGPRSGQLVVAGRLAGCVVAYAAPGLVVYRVP
jgi:hypothetical protein